MDILNLSSVDIPYRDTNYTAIICAPITAANELNPTRIRCTKVQMKEFQEFTYFKFVCDYGLTFSCDEPLSISITRDDDKQLMCLLPVKNNIITLDTVNMKWSKVDPSTLEAAQEFWSRMGIGGRTTLPPQPVYDPPRQYPPIWISPGTTSTDISFSNGVSMTGTTIVNANAVDAIATSSYTVSSEDIVKDYLDSLKGPNKRGN